MYGAVYGPGREVDGAVYGIGRCMGLSMTRSMVLEGVWADVYGPG